MTLSIKDVLDRMHDVEAQTKWFKDYNDHVVRVIQDTLNMMDEFSAYAVNQSPEWRHNEGSKVMAAFLKLYISMMALNDEVNGLKQ